MRRIVIITLLLTSCAHQPRVAELHTKSREDALARCEQALRTRYATVSRNGYEYGCLQTDERYSEDPFVTRSRAFIVLTPGQHGWAAEITVLTERLDADSSIALSPSARWIAIGRDRAMEAHIQNAIEEWLPNAPGAFEDAPPASAPAAGGR
ncbi:MAG: hypothetical protein ACKVS6_14045 [Planctomycetota bacterium]